MCLLSCGDVGGVGVVGGVGNVGVVDAAGAVESYDVEFEMGVGEVVFALNESIVSISVSVFRV